MSDVTTDTLQGLPVYNQKLQIISASLLGAGIIYLIAANWLNFPAAIQLAIPQVLLVIACLLTIYFSPTTLKGHCSAAFAALMIGLSFATYGQIYQTGADSFQLFAVWSLLLLPWFYFRLPAIFSLFYITLSLTYYLADQQWLGLDHSLYWLGFSVLLIAFLLIAQYCSPGSRLVLLLIITVVSILATIENTFNSYHDGLSFGLMSIIYLLPLFAAGFFYFKKWPVGIAIAILIFAINTTFQFIRSTIVYGDLGAGTLLVIAMIIILWCWFLSKILQYFIPNNLNWSSLPAFLGAWIASLLSASALFVLFESAVSVLGLLFLAVGFLLIKYQTSSLFAHQLSYAMALCGQVLFFSQLANSFSEAYSLIIAQAILVVFSWYITPSQVWRTIQCLIFISLFRFFSHLPFDYLIFIPFIIWLFAPTQFMQPNWRRPILCSLIAIAATSDVSILVYNPSIIMLHFSLFHLVALVLFSAIYVMIFCHTNLILMVLFIALAILLLAINLPTVLALLLALMLISQCHDKLMNFLLMTALAFCLCAFYYSLEIPLIYKGITIIASGVLVGLLSYFNSQILKETK